MRPVCAAVVLALALLVGAQSRARAQDGLVPAGVAWIGTELTRETLDRAYDDGNRKNPLRNLLVPSAATREHLSGNVTRDVTRLNGRFLYGLDDTWNLVLGLPLVRVEQASSLRADADPEAQAAADRLTSQTVSGVGRLELGSLHRPVFSDRNGFIVGYGVTWPVAAPQQPWAGRATLQTDSPFPAVQGSLRYTRYPYIDHSRLDVLVRAAVELKRTLELAGGGSGVVEPGNQLSLSLGWSQEFGPVSSGIAFRLFRTGKSRVDDVLQGDDVQENALRLSLGYGNLTDLETGGTTFPYLLRLSFDRTLHGRNTPFHRTLGLGLEFYF